MKKFSTPFKNTYQNIYSPTEIAKAYAQYFGISKADYYPLRQQILDTVNIGNLGVRDDQGNNPKFNLFTASDIAIVHFAKREHPTTARIIISSYNAREAPNLSIFRLEEILVDQNRIWDHWELADWELDIARYGIFSPERMENQQPLETGVNVGPVQTNYRRDGDNLPMISIRIGLWWLPQFWACLEHQKR